MVSYTGVCTPIIREDLIELISILIAEKQKYYIRYNTVDDLELESLMTQDDKIKWLKLEYDLGNLKNQINAIDFEIKKYRSNKYD